jgi:hypothetical protein
MKKSNDKTPVTAVKASPARKVTAKQHIIDMLSEVGVSQSVLQLATSFRLRTGGGKNLAADKENIRTQLSDMRRTPGTALWANNARYGNQVFMTKGVKRDGTTYYFHVPNPPVVPLPVDGKMTSDQSETNDAAVQTCGDDGYPDEVARYVEGATKKVFVNIYERRPEARIACIKHHGSNCSVCNFDFEVTYGEIGRGFIHVHHLHPIASMGSEYEIDPINDLRPVCPNCHAMLHRSDPPFSIDELLSLVRRPK